MSNKPSYAVIVGRFQVDDLHQGHQELFQKVLSKHDQLIVFVGCTPAGLTKRNPLSFKAREAMLRDALNVMVAGTSKTFSIHPLLDKKTDDQWSAELDQRISDQVNYGTVTLYGARDSFVPHYSGHHKVKELELEHSTSGTEVREKLTNHVMSDPKFRAGMVHAQMQMYDRCITTVDIAVLLWSGDPTDSQELEILLARKPFEKGWRFAGGHAEPPQTTTSFEADARKETMEELTKDLSGLAYVGSTAIDDWRWRNQGGSGIKTMLFVGYASGRDFRAQDDVAEARWFKFYELTPAHFEPEHRVLYEMLRTSKFVR